ncbi:MAG: hypothetical protein ACTH2U_04250 [Brevibacterium sp.]
MDGDYFSELRQGSVLNFSGESGLHEAHVIVSQTCDVVLSKREYLQLAPLVDLEEGLRRQALKRENPRYPQVGQGENCKFADLAQIVSVLKSDVSEVPSLSVFKFPTEVDEREFGLAVGRWFARYAFPDHVQPWLAPVQRLVRSKYLKPESPLGRVLNQISEIRVESDDWNSEEMQLTLHLIVEAGRLPAVPDDVESEMIDETIPGDANLLAQEIGEITPGSDPLRTNALWGAFAEALAARCRPTGGAVPEGVRKAVSEVVGEVYTDDEFPLSKMRKSEQLDLDFLSPPMPLGDYEA